MKTRRKFTKEFKQTAVRRLESGQSVGEVARALEVHPSDLQRWRRELREHGERAFNGAGKKRAEESRVAELERKVGQQAMEIDFLNEPCSMSRNSACCKRYPTARVLPAGGKRSEHRDQVERGADV